MKVSILLSPIRRPFAFLVLAGWSLSLGCFNSERPAGGGINEPGQDRATGQGMGGDEPLRGDSHNQDDAGVRPQDPNHQKLPPKDIPANPVPTNPVAPVPQ